MSNNQSIPSLPELIAKMLSGGMGSIQVVPVEVREGETLEQAIVRADAEHRAGCAECQAEYDKAQASVPKDEERPMVSRPELGAGYGAGEAPVRDRQPIGYMAFVTARDSNATPRPVSTSFHTSREFVESRLEVFKRTMPYTIMEVAGLAPVIDVKPVFAD